VINYADSMDTSSPRIQWIFSWADAVERQRQRVEAAQDLVSAQPDAMLFAVAIGGLLQNAEMELGKGHRAIQVFKEQVPNSKDIRDIVSHLDNYSQGTGRLQKDGRAGRLTTLMRGIDSEIELTFFGYELLVPSAADAAAELAAAVLDARDQK
jgi:hypothetical protein